MEKAPNEMYFQGSVSQCVTGLIDPSLLRYSTFLLVLLVSPSTRYRRILTEVRAHEIVGAREALSITILDFMPGRAPTIAKTIWRRVDMPLPRSAKIQRRQFLAALGAAGTLPGLLTACQPGSIATNTSPSPMLSARKAPTVPPTPHDWTELAKNLQGKLVRSDHPQYATASQLFDPRFDTIKPSAIAYCATPADVQACLAFANSFIVPLAIRSGGHSYGGYSTTTGLVIDVSRMNAVTVDETAGTAIIGAGTRLIDVYSTLARHGMALPAGSCPTVGIGGLTQGGGVGFLSRKFGLTIDNLQAAQVVLADGRVLTCDSTHEADLFWALRGGGGGNFGVVTSFTFQVHPVSTLTLFTLGWPWSLAATVVDAWQSWAPHAPDELVVNCHLDTGNTEPQVRLVGLHVGSIASLNDLLTQLIGQVGAPPTIHTVWGANLLDAMLYEADCKTLAECSLPSQNPKGQVQRTLYGAKSDYFSSPLPRQGIDFLLSAISRSQSTANLNGSLDLEVYGGAINRVKADATAFAHRDALFCMQYTATWNPGDPTSVIEANRSWMHDLWLQMRSYATGGAYPNYIDPDLPDSQHAYYLANLPRLQHIKSVYDPTNLFRFAQSIPLAT